MRIPVSALALCAAAALLPVQQAQACVVAIAPEDPPPRTATERAALRQRMAESDRMYRRQLADLYNAAAALIEVELLTDPNWRRPDRARVLTVYKGDYTAGQEIRVQLPEPSGCGGLFQPSVARGSRGVMMVREPSGPIPFWGFMAESQLEMLRDARLIPRRRR